ncbi:MAG: hypothetical protein CR978_01925 [Gammaproteobacteria bacterium]|nr:MAG: hypothetical protein CR978_01925 [Gammaproteobacteria bacterium]
MPEQRFPFQHRTPQRSALPVANRLVNFSPELAQAIGLENAILLQTLKELRLHHATREHNGYAWYQIPWGKMELLLPFWNSTQILRFAHDLQARNLLYVAQEQHRHFTYALAQAETLAVQAPHPVAPQDYQRNRKQTMSDNWSPSDDILQKLAVELQIPPDFANAQLDEFRRYWQETGETAYSWDNRFFQRVKSEWQRHRSREQEQQEAFIRKNTPFDKHWTPDEDALDLLFMAQIPKDFIAEALPEFVLYWREREAPESPNAKFVAHVKHQWARHTRTLNNDREPTLMSKDWQPSQDAYDTLRLSHIDPQFAQGLVPEFILYWIERGDALPAWNARFVQHVKHQWARIHQMTSQANARQQRNSQSTRARTLEQDLNDRSWAQ